MIFPPQSIIGRFLHRRALARWKNAARNIDRRDLAALEVESRMANQIMRDARKFKLAADDRLNSPPINSETFPRPPGTDWAWRPEVWRAPFPGGGIAPAMPKDRITNEVVIFHDCKTAEVCLRQSRNMREIDLSPYSFDIEIFHFDGSYLSLVIEIPTESCEGLRKRHLIRLAAIIEKERPTKIYARLNIKHGPNTEQVLLTLPDTHEETMVEFDLAYSHLNERRAERMWLDLMIEEPAMNKIRIRDLTLSRYPRSEI
ncbi:DUF6478 family protein [Yoonia sp.]|uniref:DUF6478 family protein n=1 Tax=Yoonia sp. TaxID=2212373 RepID=UPI0035C83C04